VLDTVKIRSPFLDEAVARVVEGRLQRRTCTDLSTGEVLWEFTSGPLTGSWDHRVSVQVERHVWKQVDTGRLVAVGEVPIGAGGRRKRTTFEQAGGGAVPVRVPSKPYLVVEGSIHKAMLGHNVWGGPEDLQAPVMWFVDRLAEQLGVTLPPASSWLFRRVDWAECFNLGSFEAVQEYVSYLHNAKFPRRRTTKTEEESINIAGTTTTVKLYHKGPEFEVHDRKRLLQVGRRADRLDEVTELVNKLQARANMLLRCEVEIHARTFDEEYSIAPGPAVGSPEILQWIQSLHDRDLARVLREGTSAMQTVRTSAAVRRRLFDLHSERQAAALYATWMELSAMGEASVRSHLNKVTFWRHRKLLVEAGCSWHDGDVKIDSRVRLVPEDFSPVRSDPRRVVGEAFDVALDLAPYRQAS